MCAHAHVYVCACVCVHLCIGVSLGVYTPSKIRRSLTYLLGRAINYLWSRILPTCISNGKCKHFVSFKWDMFSTWPALSQGISITESSNFMPGTCDSKLSLQSLSPAARSLPPKPHSNHSSCTHPVSIIFLIFCSLLRILFICSCNAGGFNK